MGAEQAEKKQGKETVNPADGLTEVASVVVNRIREKPADLPVQQSSKVAVRPGLSAFRPSSSPHKCHYMRQNKVAATCIPRQITRTSGKVGDTVTHHGRNGNSFVTL